MSNTNGVNDTRLKDLMKEVREYGRDAALGKDSLPKLAVRVVRASNDGVITTEKDKDGTDDAKRLYQRVRRRRGQEGHPRAHRERQEVEREQAPPARHLRRTHHLRPGRGAQPRHRPAPADGAAKETVKPAYAGYVDVAREQIKTDRALDDEELKGVLRKKESAEPDIIRVLERVKKQLDQLITGEKGLKDTSEQVLRRPQAHQRAPRCLRYRSQDRARSSRKLPSWASRSSPPAPEPAGTLRRSSLTSAGNLPHQVLTTSC